MSHSLDDKQRQQLVPLPDPALSDRVAILVVGVDAETREGSSQAQDGQDGQVQPQGRLRAAKAPCRQQALNLGLQNISFSKS